MSTIIKKLHDLDKAIKAKTNSLIHFRSSSNKTHQIKVDYNHSKKEYIVDMIHKFDSKQKVLDFLKKIIAKVGFKKEEIKEEPFVAFEINLDLSDKDPVEDKYEDINYRHYLEDDYQ